MVLLLYSEIRLCRRTELYIMKSFYILLINLVCLALFCSACSGRVNDTSPPQTAEVTAQTETTAENALLSAKLTELGGVLIASCNYGDGEDDILAAIAYGAAPSVDIWRFTDKTEELVMPFCGMLSDTYGIHSENGVDSLVICSYSPGMAHPATILSLINGEVVVFSEYKGDIDSGDLLWYCDVNGAGLICKKGIGISAGSFNVIPYYLDTAECRYKPYGLTEISIDEARELDKNNVIPDTDKAISAYRRDNGLIHINYDDVTEAAFGDEHIASRTFVTENGCLRSYEDGDTKYGFFLQSLTVTE